MTTTYNAMLPLPIGQVPQEDTYQEFLDIHNSLEILATKVSDVLTGLELNTYTLTAVTTVTSDYSALVTDYVILVYAGATITLPDSSLTIEGKRYEIKCIDADNNAFVVGDTLEGGSDAAEIRFPQSVTVVNSASGWWIV